FQTSFLKRLIDSSIYSLLLSIPIMIIEMVSMFYSGLHLPIGYKWYVFICAAVVIFYFGRSYYLWSFHEIFKLRRIGMATLITISTWLSFFYSTYILIDETIQFVKFNNVMHIMSFFEIGTTIIAIVNLGEFISMKIKNKSQKDIDQIFKLQVDKSFKFDYQTKTFIEIDTKNLKIGDLVQIKKGARIPIDGIVTQNSTEVDESLLTGEATPIVKQINDKVISSSINIGSPFILKVLTTFDNSFIQKIINNVKTMEEQKIKSTRIVDIVSKWFTPIILLCGVLAFLLQMFVPNILDISNGSGLFGNVELSGFDEKWERGLYFFIATISISCPCAIGIAAPIAILVGVGKGAKNGILFSNAETFEKIKKINVIAFDKTGTLTEGKLKVSDFYGNVENLKIISKIEKVSLHPLAKSLVKYCEENNIVETKEDFIIDEIVGVGLFANKDKYIICSLNFAINKKIKIHSSIKEDFDRILNMHGDSSLLKTIIVFVKKDIVENIIIFQDNIRDDAKKIIAALQKKNIEICIISGDSASNVEHVANYLNIKKYFSNVDPSRKAAIIKEMQNENKKVAYVGDGINDLIALQQADLSFSMTHDNDAAKSIADINLMDLNIANIYKSIYLTKQTRCAIITNLLWAFGYNIVVVPLAILGFIPAIVGVYIMAISDITVNLNSLIFKTMKIKSIK
ncbi:MAG: cation-translocating P-type ATPase, partial [Malacoplasma sp.]